MNLYSLSYKYWRTHEGTTSDGFLDTRQDWKGNSCDFEAESDLEAQEKACKILRVAIHSGLKLQSPVLARVTPLPRVEGVQTHLDLQPWWQYSHYFQEEAVPQSV